MVNNSNSLMKWAAYALLLFVSMLAVSVLLGELYVPVKQYLAGYPVDFAEHWQQVNWAKKVPIALLFAAVLSFSKYRRERTRANSEA